MFEWISQYISLDPTATRWGVFAIFFALAIFFFGVSGRIQQWAEQHTSASKALFGLGVLFACLTIFWGVFWLAQGSRDTTSADLQDIKSKIENMEKNIENRFDDIDITLEELINE